jgi:hypothetical protein
MKGIFQFNLETSNPSVIDKKNQQFCNVLGFGGILILRRIFEKVISALLFPQYWLVSGTDLKVCL